MAYLKCILFLNWWIDLCVDWNFVSIIYVWELCLQLTIAIEMFDIVKFVEQIKMECYWMVYCIAMSAARRSVKKWVPCPRLASINYGCCCYGEWATLLDVATPWEAITRPASQCRRRDITTHNTHHWYTWEQLFSWAHPPVFKIHTSSLKKYVTINIFQIVKLSK